MGCGLAVGGIVYALLHLLLAARPRVQALLKDMLAYKKSHGLGWNKFKIAAINPDCGKGYSPGAHQAWACG